MPAGAGQDSERFAAAVEYGESVVPPGDEQLLDELEVVALLRHSRASLAPTGEESARMRARVMAAAATMLSAPNSQSPNSQAPNSQAPHDQMPATAPHPLFDEAPTVVAGPAVSDTEETAVLGPALDGGDRDGSDGPRDTELLTAELPGNVVGIGTAKGGRAGRHRFPTNPKASSARRRGLLAVSAAAALMVLAVTGGGAMFSQGALPGDSLYGVKQAAESALVGLTPGQGNKAQRQLDYAATRLDEIQQLDAGQAAASDRAADVSQALQGFDQQTTAGTRMWLTSGGTHNAAELGALANWAQTQSQRLSELRDRMPTAAQPDADHSLRLLEDLRTRAQSLSNRQGCERITSGESDELGPLPAKGACSVKESTPAPTTHLPAPSVPTTGRSGERSGGSDSSSDSSSDAPSTASKSGKSKQDQAPGLPGLGDLTGGHSDLGKLPTKESTKGSDPSSSTTEAPAPGLNLPLLLPILFQPLAQPRG